MTSDGLELYTAKQFLYTQLTADATLAALGVDDESAQPDATFPRVQFRWLAGTPSKPVNDTVVLLDFVFLVVAVAEAKTPPYSFQPLQDYVGRIFTQLNQQSGTTANGQTLWSTFEEPFQQRYIDANTTYQYREEGGRYRLYVQN